MGERTCNGRHVFGVLGALRFMRKIIGLKDEFYYRYIIRGELFKPVVDSFLNNKGRYNLLDSAILELFEFIKVVSGRGAVWKGNSNLVRNDATV